jgi:hypothetical protein
VHVVLLVDTNAAAAKGMPKPQSTSSNTSQGRTVVIQRFECLARFVDYARIAANELEVLQVCCTGSSPLQCLGKHSHVLKVVSTLVSVSCIAISPTQAVLMNERWGITELRWSKSAATA